MIIEVQNFSALRKIGCARVRAQPLTKALIRSLHSVVYDSISAHFFPCGYVQNVSIQFIKKIANFRFGSYPQGYW